MVINRRSSVPRRLSSVRSIQGSKAHLRRLWREEISTIREQLVTLVKKGEGPQDLVDAGAMDEFADVMPGDAATFLYQAYRGLWLHARELGGVV